MILKVNCKYNDDGAWCTNKNIKRSLFGIGARMCRVVDGKSCEFKEPKTKKPNLPENELLEVNDLIEFDDDGRVRRGRIQVVGKHGYWINSGSLYNGSIRCPFDKAILIEKHKKNVT